MKNQYYIALCFLAILLVGTVLLLPEERSGPRVEGVEGSSNNEQSSKSVRESHSSVRGDTGMPLAAGEARRRKAKRLAAGKMEVFGRTFILPVRESPSIQDSPESQTPGAALRSGSAGADRVGSGPVQATLLAEQVIAHRQGRREFMKRRAEELAAHTPGCTCAHHIGQK